MPQTPRVRFNFKNLNVQSSVPLLGVINVVARTTKSIRRPEGLDCNSLTVHSHLRFGNSSGWFGINIMKAWKWDAKVRVSRVAGVGATYGWAKLCR